MRISSRAHYGLRMMTELGKAYGQGPLSLTEIARTEHLPLAYLEQLVAPLRRGGLVEGTRGVHGGYRLTRDPAVVSVREIIELLEGKVAPVECLTDTYLPGGCVREPDCHSRSLWGRLQAAVNGVLGGTTLQDLISEAAAAPTLPEPGLIPVGSLARFRRPTVPARQHQRSATAVAASPVLRRPSL